MNDTNAHMQKCDRYLITLTPVTALMFVGFPIQYE